MLITDWLMNSANRFPDKLAFSDVNKSISFGELARRARRAGARLAKESPIRTPIAFYMDKSVDTVIGFMGAAFAGCPYSLLNLRHPISRIQSIVNTLQPEVIVTDAENAPKLDGLEFAGKIILLDDILNEPADDALIAERQAAALDIDPLYINFTSGSTGTPKGVAICHRNVCDFIPCFANTFSITDADVLINQAPFDFDVSVKDIFSGIYTGARVEIVPTEYFMNPTKLIDFICDRHGTVLIWAVSALCFLTTMKVFDYRIPTELRAVMFSGEVMPIKHLNKLREHLPDVMYVNLYGPTEITCNCTYHIIDREYAPGDTIPIGKPFANERVFLLNEQNGLVTVPDTPGEICVSGTSVGLGYYRAPEATAAAIVQSPLNDCYPEIIYRTGDMASYSAEGELLYIGRKDFQIKHMGHRIELGEIERAISALDGVERTLCVYAQEKGRIYAFYSGNADAKGIKSELAKALPAYMIPNKFVNVESMPMTKNGKVDRKALMDKYM